MRTGHSYLIQHILLFTALLSAYTQAAIISSAQNSPSWIVQSKSFAMVVFSLAVEDVKKFLPAGVIPQLNEKGKVTTTLEVYNTEQIAGIPTYKIAFIVVDIASHSSRHDIPGHFAIWGRTDSESSQDFFRHEFGFPYKVASQLHIQSTATSFKTSIANELQIHIEPLRDKPVEAGGTVNMMSVRAGTGLIKTEVPFLTKGYFGNLVSFTISAREDPLLGLLKSVKPDWALVSEQQIFAYLPWVVVGK
jgi:hypothetical protein